MLCSGSAGPFQRGWLGGDRQAVVGEGERLPGTKRGGAGRKHAGGQRAAGSGRVGLPAVRRPPPARRTEAAMPTLTMRELAEMTGGEVVQNPDVVVSSVVIDSR